MHILSQTAHIAIRTTHTASRPLPGLRHGKSSLPENRKILQL